MREQAHLAQGRVVGSDGERRPDLAGDDAQPGDGGGLAVTLLERAAGPGGGARVPAGVPQGEEEPAITRVAEMRPRNPQARASIPALITPCLRGRGGRSISPGSAGSRSEQLVQLLLGHGVQFGPVDQAQSAGPDAGYGQRGGGQAVVAGDHVDPDTGPVYSADCGGDFGPRRVEHRDQPDQA